tara:strand:+ start:85 stop:351 length:267 start_codon:yes stop_codon:yes gene_type:complete
MEPITTIIVLCSIGLFGVSIKYLSYRCEQEQQEDLMRIYQHPDIPPIYSSDKPPPYSEHSEYIQYNESSEYDANRNNNRNTNSFYNGT